MDEQVKLEWAQQDLADALFDAYVSGNIHVITEVDAELSEPETSEHTINLIREAMTEECARPTMGRGCVIYKAMERQISAVCESIAKRHKTLEEVELADYGI